MLSSRIIGALTFKRQAYAEAEKDDSFTGTAWAFVAVVAILSQLGLAVNGSANITIRLIIGVVIGSIFSILGFLYFVGLETVLSKVIFKSKTDFGNMIRSLGLAQTWGIVTNFLALVVPGMTFFSALALLGYGATIISHFIAAREAMQLNTGKTLVILTIVSAPIICYLIFGIVAVASI